MAGKTAAKAGADDQKTTDIGRISRTMSRMRVLIKSRALGRHVMGSRAPDLDASYLDIIEFVRRRSRDGDVTIGAVAEHMCMDPSRASRAVSLLVDRGMLRRDVSQADARRAVIVLTDTGEDVLGEKRRIKLAMLDQVFADWSEAEVAEFSDLFSRFIDGLEKTALPERE